MAEVAVADADSAVIAVDPRVAWCLARTFGTDEEGIPLTHGITIETDGDDTEFKDACSQHLPLKRRVKGMCEQRDRYIAWLQDPGRCCSDHEVLAVRRLIDGLLQAICELFNRLQGTDLELTAIRRRLVMMAA